MQLPFTVDEFFAVFRDYNEAVWPAQVGLTGLAVAALAFMFVPRAWSGIVVSAILASLWTWLGIAYHLVFFSRVNPIAWVFGLVSLLGALAFVSQGVIRRRLRFGWVGGARAVIGTVLVAFSLAVYPAWSWLAGHAYPAMPTFGLPCPTTIFTLGVLAFLEDPYPGSPFVAPVLWCIVGTQAAFLLGVTQDLALVVAGAAGLVLLAGAWRRHHPKASECVQHAQRANRFPRDRDR